MAFLQPVRPASNLATVATLIALRQWTHQVQFLSLFVRVDRRALVMIDQLVERVELSLTDAVESTLYVNPKVFVASWRF